jgi:hypothetical protein
VDNGGKAAFFEKSLHKLFIDVNIQTWITSDSLRASRMEVDEKKEPHDLPGSMRLRGFEPVLC